MALSGCAQPYKKTADEYYHQSIIATDTWEKCNAMHKAFTWYDIDLTNTHDQTNQSRPEYQKVQSIMDQFQAMGCGDLRHMSPQSYHAPSMVVAPHAPIVYNKPYGAYRPSIIPSDYTRFRSYK